MGRVPLASVSSLRSHEHNASANSFAIVQLFGTLNGTVKMGRTRNGLYTLDFLWEMLVNSVTKHEGILDFFHLLNCCSAFLWAKTVFRSNMGS